MGKVIKISDDLYKKLLGLKGDKSFSELIAFLLGHYTAYKEAVEDLKVEIVRLRKKVEMLVYQ